VDVPVVRRLSAVGLTLAAHGTQKLFGWFGGLVSGRVLESAKWPASQRPSEAHALITIASQEPPPRRFIAGADAIATAEQKIADLKAQIEAHRELSTSRAFA
jgi:hypothetical protein